MGERRYIKPAAGDRLFNSLIAGLARLGIGVYGARILAVRGRKSGQWRTIPVNLLELAGSRYIVAPRGETEWVRNLRASKSGELRLGTRWEPFKATELADADKIPILRAYVAKWWFEVKRFFELSGPNAPDSEIARIASSHPVFRIEGEG